MSYMRCSCRVSLLLVPADEIKQWKQKDPDDVDKVPVQSEVFNKSHMPGGVGSGLGSNDHEAQDADADHHVQRVHPGHGEIEEEVLFNLVGHVRRKRLVMILGIDLRIRRRIEERVIAIVQAGNVE